jgi:hypothetical protein
LRTDSWGGYGSADLPQTTHLIHISSFVQVHTSHLTHNLKLKPYEILQRAILKDQHPIGRLLSPFHGSEKCGVGRINCLAFGEQPGSHGGEGNPELRVVWVFPHVKGRCGVEEPDAVKKGADAPGCRLYFVGSGGEELVCECLEAGNVRYCGFMKGEATYSAIGDMDSLVFRWMVLTSLDAAGLI